MKLTEMHQLLAGHRIRLTKSLGQNFLHDGNQLRRIVAAAELRSTDRVLEIGPGLGPLTELLMATAREVLAIELDARLVEILRGRFNSKIEILHDDALDLLRREPRSWSGWKLVSNLPYSVASPILVELALASQPPDRLVATLQLEVAQRLMAQAGDEHYGLLSLLMQLRYVPRGSFTIPASCFFPAPDVDSACIRLDRREAELLPFGRHGDFVRLVKLAFSQRRKMMLKLLKTQWPEAKVTAAFAELKISPQERAEKLSLEQFVALTGKLCP